MAKLSKLTKKGEKSKVVPVFETLAVLDKSHRGNPSGRAVEEAKEWVDQNRK